MEIMIASAIKLTKTSTVKQEGCRRKDWKGAED